MAKFSNYLSALKSPGGLLASVGTLIPALSQLTTYPPPLFEDSFGQTGLLTSAIALATIIITFYYAPSQNAHSGTLPLLVRKAAKVLIVSIILFIIYIVLLHMCTVLDLPGKYRYQIGFSNFQWSLTPHGQQVMSRHPNFTVRDLMEHDALYPTPPSVEAKTDLTWKPWTIYLSGVLMILVFIFSFVLWTLGWSLLALQKMAHGRSGG
ncbi:MAG TPA: hypothetical protein VK619_20035 [Pyrinomonadaceae bacterium]|nr:hypothetical protein [Pyrinomonadaceae bacterium]